MQYLWQEFNIKTFPAETLVYRDGVFMPELSTLETTNIDKKYDLPVHIIYVGEIVGDQNLNLAVVVPEQKVFLTVKIQNKNPAFLSVFVKNTGKNSEVIGKILAQNYSDLKITTTGEHTSGHTKTVLKTRVVAHDNTKTKLTGAAIINKNCEFCESDIGFSVLAAPNAKIEFSPQQLISSAPLSAEHSASIYRATAPQIEYLRSTGLSTTEIKDILQEAFLSDI